ncbi:MAG: hypothetical protein RIR12_1773 [Bacteroidota bacterium]|jgi:hypothetical protein
MTNEEYIKEFTRLKENLVNNLVVYHERVTILLELTTFEIGSEGVRFNAKIIKPLDKSYAERNNLYKHIVTKNEIAFSASYQFGPNDNIPLVKNKKVGRPYCPFTLWLDPELTIFVNENVDEVTKQIPNFILWDEDWKVLKKK